MKFIYIFAVIACLSVLTQVISIVSGVLSDDKLLESKVLSDPPKSCACGGRRDSQLSALLDSDSSDSTVHVDTHDYNGDNDSDDKVESREYGNNSYNNSNSYESNLQNMVYIEGGSFYMGTDTPQIATDGEGPKRFVTLSNYMMDR